MRFKPTKMELLRVKRELKLAEKGHKLLKKKQDGLVIEFFKVLREIKCLRSVAGRKLKAAGKSLSYAAAMHGESDIQRIATGISAEVEIEHSSKKFMGVNILNVRDVQIKGGWRPNMDSSPELDVAVLRYREMFAEIVKMAEKQLVLRNLADELKKTKRRVNALEYIIVPRLISIRDIITFKLEESDRENFARLKKIKQRVSDAA
ncbi:V-type ATP synthase subunit D [Candidatus Woesearchaeota archaeon CG11_big_fil_rev_8_21_14_0_20_43_8]|nr:MAG: V-type ATP synthase subunit D [Candidatus Woesearchaeota archaeon CG11_big_fil_rev_8_21_14_0_20_43_8]PIO05406.1 MAG: V-type ATP synthase subunit D [Candidatus Woesearchaeota archaeon CG08_land_8_20_14_0_20_43_7]